MTCNNRKKGGRSLRTERRWTRYRTI